MDKIRDWLTQILSNPYRFVWKLVHGAILLAIIGGILIWTCVHYLLPR